MFRIEIALGQACQRDTYAVKVYTADDPCHYRDDKRENIQNQLNNYFIRLGKTDMSDYLIAHMPQCRGCGKCRPGVTMDVFGQVQSGICACDMYAMRVENPGKAEFEMIKEFVAARRQYILKNVSLK